MRRLAILNFIIILFSCGQIKANQSFEEIVPYEKTYARIDENIIFWEKWITFPEEAVICDKLARDPERKEVCVISPKHTNQFIYGHWTEWEKFYTYYREKP